MKNSINKITLLITSVILSGQVFAFDQAQHEDNKKLSSTRTQIADQLLQNQLYDVQLKGLEKKKEINSLKEIVESTGSSITTKNQKNQAEPEVDRSLHLNTNIRDEDILSQENNWEQNVGFIYKDDIKLDENDIKNTPIDGLKNVNNETDTSFEKMLEEIGTSLDKNKNNESDEIPVDAIPKSDFKVTSLELNSLNIFNDQKSASIRANYLNNNGYQKIKGARIIDVKEGGVYDIKNAYSFKVKSISDNGVTVENLTTKKEQFISR